MKSKFSFLLDFTKLNVENCPWCNTKKSDYYFERLKEEVDELSDALEKKDFDNTEEEIGDVLWDTLTLIYILEKEGKVDSKRVIDRLIEKFDRRKPWLLKGEKVTSQEASRIWNEAKSLEKKK